MTAFGVELQRRRMLSDMTLGQLARQTHYSKGYLSKIENGSKPAGEDLARRCDAVLGAGGALLALVPPPRRGRRAAATGGGGRPGPAEPAAAGTPQPFRSGLDLAGLTGEPTLPGMSLPAEPPPGVQAAADLDSTAATFRDIFDHYRELGHQVSPLVVLDLLVQQTDAVHTLARGARDPDQRRRLMLLAARYAEYTGWMAQEGGDDAAAARWTHLAARLADSVGGTDLVQFALVRHADLALYREDALQTILLAQQAQADARVAPRLRGLAAQREAQGHALAGDYDACMRTLDRSATLLAAGDGTEGSDGNPVVGSTSLTPPASVVTGWALYDLGRPADAARILDVEVPRMPAAAARARARFGVRRALAHAAAGELDRACALATELLPVVQRADSATIRLDLARLARQLRRWHGDARVREVLPRLTVALQAHPR